MGVLYLLSKGSSARKDGSRLVIEKEGQLIGRMPFRSLNSIVVGAAANISTAALFACLEGNIPIFFLDKKWRPIGQLVNEKASLTKALKGLKAERGKAETVASVDSLRGIEGSCAKYYFAGFGALLDNRTWHFKGRTRPATDPANALLNFGYAFLEREVRIAVIAQGLDARIGFLHSNNDRKDSLVFDLMELFRQPVIDRFVLNLLRQQVYKPKDFTTTEEDVCRLSDEARLLWYQKYEEYMEKTYQEYEGISPRELIRKRIEQFRNELMK